MIILKEFEGFDWDEGNDLKNWNKHKVSNVEAEEIFFNRPILIRSDLNHSKIEKRYYSLGITNQYRDLFIVFTMRRKNIRIISARDMTMKEKRIYEKVKKNS